MKEYNSKKVNTSPVGQSDVDAVMKKYDRESNIRIWTGKYKIAIRGILIAFSLWCIYVTLFATFLEEIRLTSFLGLIVLIGFLTYPAKKCDIRENYMPISDIIFMLLGTGAFLYFTFNANRLSIRVPDLKSIRLSSALLAFWHLLSLPDVVLVCQS